MPEEGFSQDAARRNQYKELIAYGFDTLFRIVLDLNNMPFRNRENRLYSLSFVLIKLRSSLRQEVR